MKIALIFFDLSMPAGGQRQFLSLAQQLVSRGHQIKIYACAVDRENVYPHLWNGLDVTVVKDVRKNNFFCRDYLRFNEGYYKYLDKAIATCEVMDTDFDVINCHEDFAYRVAYFYKKINSKVRAVWSLNNVSYFYDSRGSALRRLRSWLLNIYKNFRDRRFYKCVDIVAPLSRYEEKWCRDRGLPVSIVRSGLDYDKFHLPVRDIGGGKIWNLLCIGALGPHRRFEDAIEAVRILSGKGYYLHADILCKKISGDDKEAAYEHKLVKMINDCGLNDSVNLVTAGAPEEKMADYYNRAQIFVHPVYLPPPQYYGWGLVVFEAMAAGLPVVLCNTTGATEVLANGDNALFARPLDAKDFADKIELLINDAELYHRIAVNGQNYVKDNISWKKYADMMLNLMTDKKYDR